MMYDVPISGYAEDDVAQEHTQHKRHLSDADPCRSITDQIPLRMIARTCNTTERLSDLMFNIKAYLLNKKYK